MWCITSGAGLPSANEPAARRSIEGDEVQSFQLLAATRQHFFIQILQVFFNLSKIRRWACHCSPFACLLLWQGFVQGILSGIGSVIGYAYAVRSLGLPRASAFTSLVPPLAAVGGWLILGETVSLAGWASVICACLGVYLVNLAVTRGS